MPRHFDRFAHRVPTVIVLLWIHGGDQLRFLHHVGLRGLCVFSEIRQAHLQRCQVRLTIEQKKDVNSFICYLQRVHEIVEPSPFR